MDNSIDRSAPYAPINSVVQVIRRFRDRGLPQPLTAQELTRVGVSEGNARRTLTALRFLDLVDGDGQVTPRFESLRRATSEEYPGLLAEVVKDAYEEVFKFIDPTTATDVQVHDAFRHYHPPAQRTRMVGLFVGLCKEAGLIAGDVPEVRTRAKKAGARKDSTIRPVRVSRVTRPLRESNSETLLEEQRLHEFPLMLSPGSSSASSSDNYYGLLDGLLYQLPVDHQWTAKRRGRWLQAFTANLDLLVEITEEASYETPRQREREEEIGVYNHVEN